MTQELSDKIYNLQKNFLELNNLFGSSSVKKLEELGIINKFFSQKRRKPQVSEIENKQVVLNSLQQNAVDKILAENSKTFLLYGVTGSGKTEVYMHAIKKILEKNKTAIMLVPEISLTPQVMQNFVARFGDNVAILHSGLSNGERFEEWQRIFSGEAKIVVGARSAIFAPIKNLGLIIIDDPRVVIQVMAIWNLQSLTTSEKRGRGNDLFSK